MRPAVRAAVSTLILAAVAVAPAKTWAWGATGHRMVGELGAQAFPAELPAFLRKPQVAAEIGELARELDRSKGSGRIHDHDRDAAHFIDLDDQGRAFGGPKLSELPATRADYEAALRAIGKDSWNAGYLPYALIDGWQQLVKDFTYYRILVAAEKQAKDPARRRWLRADRLRREALIVRNIGVWAHYVGDAAQPLHTTVHYNGWGDYPNPENYTQERIHGRIDGVVKDAPKAAAVKAKMRPYQDCKCVYEQRVTAYLSDSLAQVDKVYQLWGKGAFKQPDAEATAFLEVRLATASEQLRDMVVDAWRASETGKIGYRPEISVADVVAGKVDPWDDLFGKD